MSGTRTVRREVCVLLWGFCDSSTFSPGPLCFLLLSAQSQLLWDGTVCPRLQLTAATALARVPGPVAPGLWAVGAAGPKGELGVSG